MKLNIDLAAATVESETPEGRRQVPLASAEAFALVSQAWLRTGWDVKYVYSFSWLGRPMLQNPEDMIRIQEVINRLEPAVIIETGVAHGGSLVFYATLCRALGRGKVIGVEKGLYPENKQALAEHRLADLIEVVEGSSIDPATLAEVEAKLPAGEGGLVLLDSNHSRDHVLAELRAYARFVAPGSYLVACDGIMRDLEGAPRAGDDWAWNNPVSAVEAFLAEREDFVLEEPAFPFNESEIRERVTYWPKAFLKRIA